jgi:hypothetical protein
VVNCAEELFYLALAGAPGGDMIDDSEFDEFMAVMRPTYEMARDAQETWMAALTDYDWPESVQANIDGLIFVAADWAAKYDAFATSTSGADWPTEEWASNEDATIIRAKLGLPSNIDGDVEHCKTLFDV